MAGTNTGNGVVPELYMFDNPQELTSSTSGAITYLEVQIVGTAGFPGNYVYYSTVAHFTPQNDFLNNVWWSNYESSDFPNANASDCSRYWQIGRNPGSNACNGVEWQSGDTVFGPVYSNDSLYTNGTPTFTGTVQTADPSCLYVGAPGSATCTKDTPPTYGHQVEALPPDNSVPKATAIQGGCDYAGPTTITFNSAGTMTVNSPLSPGYPGNLTQQQPSTDSSVCVTNGTGAFPNNGVVYVDAASSGALSNNPFYSATTGLSQLGSTICSGN